MKSKDMKIFPLLFYFAFLVFACEKDEISTGLEGTVFKGPINPVEIVGQVNDAPFAAEFHVYDEQNKFVKSFLSDDNGNFKVLLEPGEFKIFPDQSAPIITPDHQAKEISIGTDGIKQQDLYFDTGIR